MSKISVNTFEKIYKAANTEQKEVKFQTSDEEVIISVTPTIGLNEVVEFVNDVAARCVNIDQELYLPSLQDFLIRRNVLIYYAKMTMPKDAEKCYRFIYGTDVYEKVSEVINREQYVSIVDAINRQIEFELKKIANKDKFGELCDLISDMVAKFAKQFDGLDLQSFTDKIGQMENLDEKKIVDAIVGNIEAKKQENKVVEFPKTEG